MIHTCAARLYYCIATTIGVLVSACASALGESPPYDATDQASSPLSIGEAKAQFAGEKSQEVMASLFAKYGRRQGFAPTLDEAKSTRLYHSYAHSMIVAGKMGEFAERYAREFPGGKLLEADVPIFTLLGLQHDEIQDFVLTDVVDDTFQFNGASFIRKKRNREGQELERKTADSMIQAMNKFNRRVRLPTDGRLSVVFGQPEKANYRLGLMATKVDLDFNHPWWLVPRILFKGDNIRNPWAFVPALADFGRASFGWGPEPGEVDLSNGQFGYGRRDVAAVFAEDWYDFIENYVYATQAQRDYYEPVYQHYFAKHLDFQLGLHKAMLARYEEIRAAQPPRVQRIIDEVFPTWGVKDTIRGLDNFIAERKARITANKPKSVADMFKELGLELPPPIPESVPALP